MNKASLRDFLIQSEVQDFYNDLNDVQKFLKKDNNKYPLLTPIHEAVILPENVKISSNLENVEDLNKEFKKLNVIFHLNNGALTAFYDQEKDEIHVNYNTSNTKLEIEAMIGHEMIHREQNKRSSGNYFEKAKKLTDELNKIADKYNKTKDIKVFKEYQDKIKFKNFDDSYEQMAYVYQVVKENKDLTPNQLVKYFEKFGFKIDFKLKKYIGMYYLIKDKI